MPLLWRYLLAHYFKILVLSTTSLLAVLLTTRLDEIAHFACLGCSWWQVMQFIGLQLPYLLPLALPIAALLSAYLTFRQLSHTHELTAMRASGLSLKAILAPILTGAAILAIFNFYLVSELAPMAHLKNGLLKHELRSINPLLLLSNKRLLQMQGIYGEALGSVKHGKWAHDVILALPATEQKRQQLIVAKRVTAEEHILNSSQVTHIGAQPNASEGFDELFIENIATVDTPLADFAPFLKQRVWSLHPDHLQLSLLIAAIEEEKAEIAVVTTPESRKRLHTAYSEIARRLSLALAFFTFSLLGAVCGIQLGRQPSLMPTLEVTVLTGLYLVSYFLAKSLEDRWIIAVLLLTLPHLIIITVASWRHHRLNRGLA
jgi:lipopolysaccharide export system permease protein